VPMDESRERFEEGIRVIEHLWREDQLDFDGQFYHLHGIHSLPKPFQQPHPPIWIAAISSEESVAWAGRHGYNLLIVSSVGGLERTGAFVKAYRQAWREGGYKPGEEQIQVVLQCYMAETHDEAVEGFKQPRTTCMDVFKEATQSWAGISSSSYPGYSRMVSAFSAQTWRTSLEDQTALVGSPEEVATQVRHLQKIYGDVELSLEITFGNLSEAEAFRTLKLFSSYVMPLF
jgi:alkanesulfonate monooxygenase SsuD/methylene tetrahydromethanopterin reductase-like flavin-dependent oxidoreductase (luciferase family)